MNKKDIQNLLYKKISEKLGVMENISKQNLLCEEFIESKHQTGKTGIKGLGWIITKELTGRAEIPNGMVLSLVHSKTNKIVKNIRLSHKEHGKVPEREIKKILKTVEKYLGDIDFTQTVNDLTKDKSIPKKLKDLDKDTQNLTKKLKNKIKEEIELSEGRTHFTVKGKNGKEKVFHVSTTGQAYDFEKALRKLNLKYKSNYGRRYKDFNSISPSFRDYDNLEKFIKSKLKEDLNEEIDVFLDEDTGEQYYIELCENTLEERRIKIRITSKGKRIRKVKCPKGRVVKTVNGRKVCVTPTGSEKITKKLAIRKSVRRKKAKGTGYKKRTNFRRQKALKKRRAMGL